MPATRRKRAAEAQPAPENVQDAEVDEFMPEPPNSKARFPTKDRATTEPPTRLQRLRNMWEFANLVQYLYLFGPALKTDENLDIDELEHECLKPESSSKLPAIGLCMLKFLSSHRGLTPELFDEFTRRQYLTKAPHLNPFGDAETALRFDDFNVFQKLRILWQMSHWTMFYPERLRDRMGEQKDVGLLHWRIEPIGWDREDREYLCLDDDRLYRRTPPAPPRPSKKGASKSKAKSRSSTGGGRASKRRRVIEDDDEDEDTPVAQSNGQSEGQSVNVADEDVDTSGGYGWECLCISLQDYEDLVSSLRTSRDANEKILHEVLIEKVLPYIRNIEDRRVKKEVQRQKEVVNLERLALAKRSSRIAGRQEREREQELAQAEQLKQKELREAAQRDAERQQQRDEDRRSRLMTREQRLREREQKRILHEQELAVLAEDTKRLEDSSTRGSERHLKKEMERKQKELEALKEDTWIFDCAKCGVYGENIDDGAHSVACERCNVWQHSACLGIEQADAERDDFHFVCADCHRKEEEAKRPKLPSIKLKLGGVSSSPPRPETARSEGDGDNPLKRGRGRPRLSDEEKAERKRQRLEQAAAAAKQASEAAVTLPQAGQTAQVVTHMPPPGLFGPTLASVSAPQVSHNDTASLAPNPPPASSSSPLTRVTDGHAETIQASVDPRLSLSSGHQPALTSLPGSSQSPAAMRQAILNGPTLSPSGEIKPSGVNGIGAKPTSPPGLMSPPKHPSYNSYQPQQPAVTQAFKPSSSPVTYVPQASESPLDHALKASVRAELPVSSSSQAAQQSGQHVHVNGLRSTQATSSVDLSHSPTAPYGSDRKVIQANGVAANHYPQPPHDPSPPKEPAASMTMKSSPITLASTPNGSFTTPTAGPAATPTLQTGSSPRMTPTTNSSMRFAGLSPLKQDAGPMPAPLPTISRTAPSASLISSAPQINGHASGVVASSQPLEPTTMMPPAPKLQPSPQSINLQPPVKSAQPEAVNGVQRDLQESNGS